MRMKPTASPIPCWFRLQAGRNISWAFHQFTDQLPRVCVGTHFMFCWTEIKIISRSYHQVFFTRVSFLPPFLPFGKFWEIIPCYGFYNLRWNRLSLIQILLKHLIFPERPEYDGPKSGWCCSMLVICLLLLVQFKCWVYTLWALLLKSYLHLRMIVFKIEKDITDNYFILWLVVNLKRWNIRYYFSM